LVQHGADVGSSGASTDAGSAWKWVAAAAAAVTAGCAAFAVAAAISSDDDSEAVTPPGDGGTAPGEPVAIVDFSFDPGGLTVDVGATVTWTNEDPSTHSVVGRGGAFASPDLVSGNTFSMTFDEAGTYEYVCGIHPNMTGTVTVEG
jgi:plastocyanin